MLHVERQAEHDGLPIAQRATDRPQCVFARSAGCMQPFRHGADRAYHAVTDCFPAIRGRSASAAAFSSPIADELIADSDCIVAFGASLTQWTTKKGKLIAPGAVVAQVDIDVPKLGYQMPVQLAVHGDAKATAQALVAEVSRGG